MSLNFYWICRLGQKSGSNEGHRSHVQRGPKMLHNLTYTILPLRESQFLTTGSLPSDDFMIYTNSRFSIHVYRCQARLVVRNCDSHRVQTLQQALNCFFVQYVYITLQVDNPTPIQLYMYRKGSFGGFLNNVVI